MIIFNKISIVIGTVAVILDVFTGNESGLLYVNIVSLFLNLFVVLNENRNDYTK